VTRLLVLLATVSAFATSSERVLIASAAASQVGVTRQYDSSYRSLRYPGGDVPIERGVCADVVVRAFRRIGVDLQVAVHDDMKAHFAAYPQMWQLRSADANIDHRRVPNLMRFFERKGKSIRKDAAYEPGDVVAWRLPNGLHHIGVVSNARNGAGSDYLVVHNIGYGTQQEDVLRAFEIIGHYRW
jgi:uncharacterized protein YijF (DUF1287 family)